MLQQIGETFGADRGLERPSRADIASDQRQLSLDRRTQPTGAVVHQGIEATDRSVEAFDRLRERTLAPIAVLVERDDVGHGTNDSPRV